MEKLKVRGKAGASEEQVLALLQHPLLMFKELPELYNHGNISLDLCFSEKVSKYVGNGFTK